MTLSNSRYRSWECVAFLKGAVLVPGWWEKLEADPKAWPCSGRAPAPPAENTSCVAWPPPLCWCKTSSCQLGRENSVWVGKKRKQALQRGSALISQNHTELTRLENTFKTIKSNLWPNTTLSTRPWHWVPPPGMVTPPPSWAAHSNAQSLFLWRTSS